MQGFGSGDVLMTRARSPATLAGLTIYPPASRLGVFSARVGDAQKAKCPMEFTTGHFTLATSY
jgi:hypothetical protein